MIRCPKCNHMVADDAKFCGNCAAPMRPEVIHSEDVLTPQEEVDPFVGKCIDNKYYITKKIAAGGMGVVYLAMQKGVGQEVAIKKLHSMYYQNPTIVERFINEARSYGKISHPNAVKLHDLLNVNGQICIVMEYVKGKTLTQYLQSNYVFSIKQIIDISLQLADALGTVNSAGIIHRDLKTENVMLLETVAGRFSVKILDFGIAKMLDKPHQQSTEAGLIVGTPEFMAPEQCFGHPVDHRVDIYAFGVLMYAMICGRLPFTSESQMTVMQMQISSPVPAMSRPDNSEIHPGLEAIVLKCLMKAPDDRYNSFSEVITDLECLQEGKQTMIAVSGEYMLDERDDTSVWDTVSKTEISKPDVISVTPQALKSRMESASRMDLNKISVQTDSIQAKGSGLGGNSHPNQPVVKKDSIHVAPNDSAELDWEEEDEEEKTTENNSVDVLAKIDEEKRKQEAAQKDDSHHSMQISGIIDSVDDDHDSMEFSIADDSGIEPVLDEKNDNTGEPLLDGDDEGFSLGELEGTVDSRALLSVVPGPAVKKTKSRALLVVCISIMVIIGAGMLFWVLGETGHVDMSGIRAWAKNVFPDDDSQPVVGISENSPENDADPIGPGAPDDIAGMDNENGTDELNAAEPEAAPVEASRAVSRDNIDRGLLRAVVAYAKTQTDAGAVDDAGKILAEADKQKSLLSGDELTDFTDLVAKNDSLKDALLQADKARKNKNCETIQGILANLPEDATVIREQVEKSYKSCHAAMVAPPTTLED